MKCFLYVNSVSGLCLHLRDAASVVIELGFEVEALEEPLYVSSLTGPDPDTPPRFPGWSRLVESHCTISKECTKGPHLKEKINTCSTTIPQLYRKIHDRPIQM